MSVAATSAKVLIALWSTEPMDGQYVCVVTRDIRITRVCVSAVKSAVNRVFFSAAKADRRRLRWCTAQADTKDMSALHHKWRSMESVSAQTLIS